MNAYKKFSLISIAVLFGFVLYNAVVWKYFTEAIMTAKLSIGGDLVRMGYIHGVKCLRKNSSDLLRRHIEQEDYKGERIDLVTIGDSFSNGGSGGRNRYYQDYIASINNMNVMNIAPSKELNFLTLAAVYLNNGYLDTIRPRQLVISSSEKLCVDQISGTIDLDRNIPVAEVAAMKRRGYRLNNENIASVQPATQFGFINEGNFKFPFYSLYYHFSDHAFFSKTYKLSLKDPLFSVKDGKTLLCYRDDIRHLGWASQKAVESMNENLNRLADKLAGKGIKLYFMPCVDKYNLYSEFIVNNKYPRSTFFEFLRPLPKRYTLIDTKAILLPELRKGVQDIYYADDTHWSWKASKKIFEAVKFD